MQLASIEASSRESSYRRWMWIGVVVAAGQIAYASWRGMVDESDLVGFHETARHLWQTGELTQTLGWKMYLPGFAVLMLPLLVWPMWLVAPAWAVLNVVVFWWVVRACGRLACSNAGDVRSTFHARWTLPIVAVFAYAADSIALGQFNILVLALCVAAYQQSSGSRRRDGLAGLLAGLAAFIKLFPLLMVGFWLIRGQWKAAITAVLAFGVMAGGLSLAAFGWSGTVQNHKAWLMQVRGEQYAAGAANDGIRTPPIGHLMFTPLAHQWLRHNNQSLAAVVRRLTTELRHERGYAERKANVVSISRAAAYAMYLTMAGVVVALLVWAAWRTRRQSDVFGVFAAWMAAVVAFVPVYWTHYFVLLLPATSILCQRRQHSRWAKALLLAWIVGELLLGSRPLRLAGLQCWLALIVALWAMHARQPKRDAGESGAVEPATPYMASAQV